MWLALWMMVGSAQAQDTCQQVRNVRALAVRDGLDDRALRQLEATYCSTAAVPPRGHGQQGRPGRPGHTQPGARPPGRPYRPVARSQDCQRLMLMQELQVLGRGDAAQGAQIDQAATVACAMNADESRRSWPSGLTMKSSSGSWSYPSGLTAVSAGGSYSYPNGLTARSSGGTWSYPSGLTALSSSGRWSRPDGLSVDGEQGLVSWACQQQPDACQRWVNELAYLSGDARTMRLIGIGWEAAQR